MKMYVLKWLLEHDVIVNSNFYLVTSLLDSEMYELAFFNDKEEKIRYKLFRAEDVESITINFDTVSAFITFKGEK